MKTPLIRREELEEMIDGLLTLKAVAVRKSIAAASHQTRYDNEEADKAEDELGNKYEEVIDHLSKELGLA